MAKQEPLPERLQYLQSYREFLAKIPRSKIDEGTDTTLLCDLVRERIRGITETEAKEKLNADLEELEKFLSSRRDERLHFVLGLFLIAVEDPEEFVKPPEKPKPIEEWVLMDLPPKAKAKFGEESSALGVKWKGQHFYAHQCNMEDEFSRKKVLVEFAHPNASEFEQLVQKGEGSMAEALIPPAAREIRRQSVSVNLGKVTGHKYISSGESPATWKRVDYLLKIPDCYISASIQASEPFDESEWDSYLATLRFGKPAAK